MDLLRKFFTENQEQECCKVLEQAAALKRQHVKILQDHYEDAVGKVEVQVEELAQKAISNLFGTLHPTLAVGRVIRYLNAAESECLVHGIDFVQFDNKPYARLLLTPIDAPNAKPIPHQVSVDRFYVVP